MDRGRWQILGLVDFGAPFWPRGMRFDVPLREGEFEFGVLPVGEPLVEPYRHAQQAKCYSEEHN